jgi:hypothetical protein
VLASHDEGAIVLNSGVAADLAGNGCGGSERKEQAGGDDRNERNNAHADDPVQAETHR